MNFKVIIKLRNFLNFFQRFLHKSLEYFPFVTTRTDKQTFSVFNK